MNTENKNATPVKIAQKEIHRHKFHKTCTVIACWKVQNADERN